MQQQLSNKLIALCAALIFTMFFTFSGFAQFSLVSNSPANGATGVSTVTTLSMTFNAPIDTSAHFAFPENFFVSLMFFPDSLVGEPGSITLSPDFMTVYVNDISLAPNTLYWFVVVDAVSQNGDSLDHPATFTFSTGASLPSGVVAGTASYPAGTPSGALVGLFDGNPFQSEGARLVNGTVVTNAGGTYTMGHVAPGKYWPVAAKNFYINSEGDIDIQPGTALGFYDPNGDSAPDSIVVTGALPLTGINMTMHELQLQTARDTYPQIETAASGWASDAYLVYAEGDAAADGTSFFWQYLFFSPSLQAHQSWVCMGGIIFSVPFSGGTLDTTAMPTNWMDSDNMMAIAESHGGSQFRQENPDAESYASLGRLSFSERQTEAGPVPFSDRHQIKKEVYEKSVPAFELLGHSIHIKEISSLPPAWYIDYYSPSSGNYLGIVIDAVSGEVLSEPTTAAVAEGNALPVAQAWAADASLWMVAGNWNTVEPDGTTQWWICAYYSAQVDSFIMVPVLGQIPQGYGGLGGWVPQDTLLISSGWMDSDIAMAAAETSGGSTYRSTNQNVFVNASLSHWYGVNPPATAWQINYNSSNAQPLFVVVDAFSGYVYTGIADNENPLVPQKLTLSQNYPNPFNPSTGIEYYVPSASKVELAVFNTLGQKVATLVDGKLPAGKYNAEWKPQDLASGIYLISLKAAGSQVVRKMFYMK